MVFLYRGGAHETPHGDSNIAASMKYLYGDGDVSVSMKFPHCVRVSASRLSQSSAL